MNLRQLTTLAATVLLLGLVGAAFGGNIFVLPPDGNQALGVRGYTEAIAGMGSAAPPAGVFQVLMSPRGEKAIFLSSNPGSPLSFVNVTSGQLAGAVRNLTLDGRAAQQASISADGELLYVVAGADPAILYTISLVSETVLIPGGVSVTGVVKDLAVGPDGLYVFLLNSLNQLVVIDPQMGVEVARLGNMGTLNHVGISPTGRVFVTGQFQIMEFDSRPPFARVALTSLLTSPGRLIFSPNGRYMIAASLSNSIVEVYDLDLPGTNTVPGMPPSAARVSAAALAFPNSQTPVVVDSITILSDSKALVYDAIAGRILELNYPVLQVREAVFSGGLGNLSGVTGLGVSNQYPVPRTMYYTQGDQLRRYDLIAGNLVNTTFTGGGALRYAPTSSQAPAAAMITYGTGQIAGPNARLKPYAVRLVDADHRPVVGAQVNFSSTALGVQLSAPAAVTNVDGVATVVVTTTPAVNGDFAVTASVAGSVTMNLVSAVTGATGGGGPGDPGNSGPRMVKMSGDGQLTQSGSASFGSRPMVVRVLDGAGEPIPGVAISWSVSEGLVAVSPQNQLTDENGESSMTWGSAGTLGIGIAYMEHSVSASSVYGSVTFSATSYPQRAAGLDPAPGIQVLSPSDDNRALTVKIGQPLNNGVVVQVVTGGGQGVSPGLGMPKIGVRVFTPNTSPDQGPIAACEGGVAFTNEQGLANCNVLASGKPGVTTLSVDVGAEHVTFPQIIHLTVLPGDPGQPVITQGNGQSGRPGELLGQALVARIVDSLGNILPGTTVSWEIVTPGSVTLEAPTTLVADANGLVSTRVRLGSALGTHQIRLRAGEFSALFNVTTAAQIGAAIILSGNNQTGIVTGQQFPSALIVRVTDTAGQPVPNLSVVWAITSGAAQLSASNTMTATSGQASVTVTAGATHGPIVITATVAGMPVLTFNLSSRLPGPSVTTASFRNAASNEFGITPGGLVRITGQGLAPSDGFELNANLLGGRLPYTLAGVTVEFFTPDGTSEYAPIYQVLSSNGAESVLVQVPFGLQGTIAGATVTVRGGMTSVSGVPLLPASPGVLEDNFEGGRRAAVVIREDGLVVTPSTPARRGETLRMYAIGLGQTTPTADTNRVGIPDQFVRANVAVGIDNMGVEVVSAKMAENLVGVYEITFVVPATATIGPNRPLGFVMEVVPGEPIYANGSVIAIGE